MLSHMHCLLCPEDVFEEVAQFGEIENLNVCDNIADHMVIGACGVPCDGACDGTRYGNHLVAK